MAYKQNFLKGPCNKPGTPSCKDEYLKMVNQKADEYYRDKKGKKIKKRSFFLNQSYVKSLTDVSYKYEDGGVKNQYISPGDINKAIGQETTNRYDALKNTNAYKKFVKNPKAGAVVSKLNNVFSSLEKSPQHLKYQLPKTNEISSLINLGNKYANSKNIIKDLSFVDQFKATASATILSKRYPNLEKVARKKLLK